MSNSNMTVEQLTAALDAVKAELAAAMKAQGRSLSCKVTDKGGVSVYGLGRFPVTLYGSQWEKLAKYIKEGNLDKFLDENKDKLATKQAA